MKIKYLFLALVSLMMLSSCEMMKEDVDDTYCGLFVCFKYDYNLQRADMFKDHVGGVTLYVFDSDGCFIRTYEDNNIPAMGRMLYDGTYAHCMRIDDLPTGDYRFVAIANQKPYAETLGTPGAKYRRSSLVTGDDNEKLTITLDHDPILGSDLYEVSNVAPLDTLWHGMTDAEAVHVSANGYSTTTISMVRDTKMLTIGLHNLDEDRANISADDFDVYIVDNNGTLAYNNELVSEDPLLYRPFHTWDSQSTDGYGNLTDKTAHFCLTFNRLIYHEKADENALLVIDNIATGKHVAVINLTDFLSQGRNAFDQYAYSRQEYLDRAYDYYMDFFIKNETWQFAEVRINVLSWAKRIQNVDLE